jgi:hypothetical protein
MARTPNEVDGARIYVSTSAEEAGYLDDLAKLGIHGKTKAEVAKTLVGNEIERLIREGLIRARRSSPRRRIRAKRR